MYVGQSVVVILVSAAIFLALIFYLAVDIENREKWSSLAFTVAILGGIVIYGSINTKVLGFGPIAVLRTVFDMGKMFGGVFRADEFAGLVGNSAGLMFLFWVVHFFAYYSLVSALVNLLGRSAVKKYRTWLLLINNVELIFGTDENSIAFGKKISKNQKVSVVFVGSDVSGEMTIRQLGGVLYNDDDATSATDKFVRRLSVKKSSGTIRLTALSEDTDANLSYATKLLKSLEKSGINPIQTQLVMLGRGNEDAASLLASKDHYGFGSVKIFEKPELVARLLMQEHPICDAISFDENGAATENAECLLVGFGRVGQEVLRKIVANGQFEGSRFHLMVFDPAYERINGFFKLRYGAMLDNYNIEFAPYDGRSEKAFDYLVRNARLLRYIVVAVDDERTGYEIAHSFQEVLGLQDINLPIYQCVKDKVFSYSIGKEREKKSIFDTDVLYRGKMDELAIQINHYYCGESESAEKQWQDCDYFSRMSCRASADYLKSLLGRLGADKRAMEGELLENLAKSEHLRWNAFHFSMGYNRMDEDTIKARAEMFKKDGKTRVMKDAAGKLHACLISWDELDELSELEERLTGKKPDYKEMDRDNIRTVHKIVFAPQKKSS